MCASSQPRSSFGVVAWDLYYVLWESSGVRSVFHLTNSPPFLGMGSVLHLPGLTPSDFHFQGLTIRNQTPRRAGFWFRRRGNYMYTGNIPGTGSVGNQGAAVGYLSVGGNRTYRARRCLISDQILPKLAKLLSLSLQSSPRPVTTTAEVVPPRQTIPVAPRPGSEFTSKHSRTHIHPAQSDEHTAPASWKSLPGRGPPPGPPGRGPPGPPGGKGAPPGPPGGKGACANQPMIECLSYCVLWEVW